MTPDAVSNSDQLSNVLDAIDQQIRKEMDSVRARLYWQTALRDIPLEVLANALAVGLSRQSYQVVPQCRGCRKG